MKYFYLSIISLFSLFIVSCSTTPTKRIENNPLMYNDLSTKHQELVQQGQITEGMSKNAVFLAKGRPDRELVQIKDKKRVERWDYTVLSPVYHTSINPYYGWGRRRYHRDYWGVGLSPSVSYIPRLGSSVYFENDKLTGYQQAR